MEICLCLSGLSLKFSSSAQFISHQLFLHLLCIQVLKIVPLLGFHFKKGEIRKKPKFPTSHRKLEVERRKLPQFITAGLETGNGLETGHFRFFQCRVSARYQQRGKKKLQEKQTKYSLLENTFKKLQNRKKKILSACCHFELKIVVNNGKYQYIVLN